MQLSAVLFTLSLGLLAACAVQAQEDRSSPETGSFVEGEHDTDFGAISYKLYRPGSGTSTGSGKPLLVMLHGCTQDADALASGTRMNRLAELHSLLVVYPTQTPSANPQKCWNWYDPAHQARGAGEPAMIASLVQHLTTSEDVDPERVYVAGISAGGAMSLILAAHYPETFAAVGAHSAIPLGAAASVQEALASMQSGPADGRASGDLVLAAMGERARPLPLILFQGAADPVVNPANAGRLEEQWRDAMLGTPGAGADSLEAVEGERGGYPYRLRRTSRGGRVLVESWLVERLGHAWSGGTEGGSYTDPAGPDASAEMVRFFLGNSRGRS